jgi:hypothetical protein
MHHLSAAEWERPHFGCGAWAILMTCVPKSNALDNLFMYFTPGGLIRGDSSFGYQLLNKEEFIFT